MVDAQKQKKWWWAGGSALAAVAAVLVLTSSVPASAVPGAALPTRAVGEPADDYPHGEACASRIAIDVTFGSVCSTECVTEAQCPNGWACKSIQQGSGLDIGLCFPRRVVPGS